MSNCFCKMQGLGWVYSQPYEMFCEESHELHITSKLRCKNHLEVICPHPKFYIQKYSYIEHLQFVLLVFANFFLLQNSITISL